MTQDDRNPFAPPRHEDEAVVAPSSDAPTWLSEGAWEEFVAREPWARWTAWLAIAALGASVVRVAVVLVRRPGDVPRGTVVGTLVALPFSIVSAWFLERCARRLRDARQAGADAVPAVLAADHALLRGWGAMVIAMAVLVAAFLVAALTGVIRTEL